MAHSVLFGDNQINEKEDKVKKKIERRLYVDRMKDKKWQRVALVMLVAFIVRAVLMLFEYSKRYIWYDTYNYVAWWMEDMKRNGILNIYSNLMANENAMDYPPLYYTVMYLLGGKYVNGILSDAMVFMIKLFPTIMDIAMAGTLAWYGLKKMNSVLPGAIWALFPAAILCTADMAQSDALFCFEIFLFIIACTEFNNPYLESIIFAVMCLTKLQGCYFLPVLIGMLYLNGCGIKNGILALAAGGTVGVIGWMPWIIAEKNILLPIDVYLGGYSTVKGYCYNAGNIWNIFNAIGEKKVISSAFEQALSVFLLVSCMLLFAYLITKTKDIILSSFIYMFAIFMLTFGQHDRYEIYSFLLLLLCFANQKINIGSLLIHMSATTLSYMSLWTVWFLSIVSGILIEENVMVVMAVFALLLNILFIIRSRKRLCREIIHSEKTNMLVRQEN